MITALRSINALPEHSSTTDRLRVATIAAAAADPLRFDLSESAVLRTGRTLIPTLVAALPTVRHDHRDEGPPAYRLWARLSPHGCSTGADSEQQAPFHRTSLAGP